MSRDILGCKKVLLEALLNSNSHGDGHTDHGVVACGIVLSHRAYSVSFYWFVVQKRCVLSDLTFKITPPYTELFVHLVAKVVAQKSSPHTALKGAKTQCMGSTKESNRRYRRFMSQTYHKESIRKSRAVWCVSICLSCCWLLCGGAAALHL